MNAGTNRPTKIELSVTCDKCRHSFGGGYGFLHYLPNYCADLNAVAKAEAKVIEKVGDEYAKYLSGVLFETNKENYSEAMQILIYATATAEQRARAVLAAMGIEVK